MTPEIYAEKILAQIKTLPENYNFPLPVSRLRLLCNALMNKPREEPKQRLTDAEGKVLQAIKADFDIGLQPTLRSISTRLNYSAIKSAQVIVDRLIEYGYIERVGKRSLIALKEVTG